MVRRSILRLMRTVFGSKVMNLPTRLEGSLSRPVSLEALEPRLLLSGSPAFETAMIDWQGQQVEVAKDQWLVELAENTDINYLSNIIPSELGAESTLRSVHSRSKVAVLETPGQDLEDILAWAAESPYIVSLEPNSLTWTNAIVPNDEAFYDEATYDGMWGLNNEWQDQIYWDGTEFEPWDDIVVQNRWIDADIDAFEAWEIETGSWDVVIGVSDSGVDYTHPDLYLNIWLNQGEIPSSIFSSLTDIDEDGLITFYDLNDSSNSSYVSDINDNGYIDGGDLLADIDWVNSTDDDGNTFYDDLIGWNFESNSNDPMDDHGHGTHVAGTIGAIGNNGIGVAGVNWKVSIIPVKWIGSSGSGVLSDAIESIYYTTDLRANEGVNVVATNNSWGRDYDRDEPPAGMEDAIADAGENDVLFIVAAGNDLLDLDGELVHYPAAFDLDNMITVAGTDSRDWLFTGLLGNSGSNYGQNSVHLAAPGQFILSTEPTTEVPSPLGKDYAPHGGTSMAAPHVAGVVGLLAAYDPTATAAELKQIILDTVDPVDTLLDTTITGGRLNAASALRAMLPGTTYVVNTLTDELDVNYGAGDFSLREALARAATETTGTDRIEFASSLANGTITLNVALGELLIDSNVVIAGLGVSKLTIDADDESRVFNVEAGVTATIYGLTIKGGSNSSGLGGNIYNEGNLTIDHVVVKEGSSGYGGGVAQTGTDANLYIVASTIRDNEAEEDGGGVYADDGLVKIIASTISDNAAAVDGGGGYFDGTAMLMMGSSTVSGNDGNGVSFYSEKVGRIVASTITDNTESTALDPEDTAGGVNANTYEVGSLLRLHHSIVACNTGGDIWGYFDLALHNLIGDGDSANIIDEDGGNIVGTESAPVDPKLGALADNGGPTMTHMLESDSPAIDAGRETYVYAGPIIGPMPYDQRGFKINTYKVGEAGPIFGVILDIIGGVDIGAVEWQPSIVVNTLVDEFDGDLKNQLSLREALHIASLLPGTDEIVFDESLAGGTITQDSGLTYFGQFVINSDVVIQGLGNDELTIEGNGLSRVFTVSTGVTAEISDLTIAGGYSPTSSWIGGNITNDGDLTLARVIVEDGTAVDGGGIGQSYNASLHLVDSIVRNNTASDEGGGIFANGGSILIESSTITGNDAYYGGGITYWGTASNDFEVTNSTISNNDATEGGGIWISDGHILIESSTISGNSANTVGGGIYILEDFYSDTYMQLINSTISGNENEGLRILVTTVDILNSTITDNTDGAAGTGGIILQYGADVLLTNTIVAGNEGHDTSGTFDTTSHHNLIGDGDADNLTNGVNSNIVGTASSPVDVKLGSLANNGGPTLTHLPLLELASPVINAGSNSAAASLDYDQRGEDRINFDTVDIGAVEVHTGLIVSIATDEVDGNFSANDLSLRERLLVAAYTTGSDTIEFSSSLIDDTITLNPSLGQLVINSDMTIQGLGVDQLTIDGDGESRVFYISSGVTAEIHDLTISGGYVDGTNGGGNILNNGDLTLDSVVVENGLAYYGAGILQTSSGASLNITNSIIHGNDNTEVSSLGSIYASAGSVLIDLSMISDNLTLGGYFTGTTTLTITRSTVSSNDGQGLAFWGDSVGVIDSSSILNNSDYGIRFGGNSETEIINTTISGNGDFGLYYSMDSTGEILNSTITNNSEAGVIGAGIFVDTDTSVMLNNTIVAGNSGSLLNVDLQGDYDIANSYNNLIGVGEYSNFDDQHSVHGNIVGTESSPVDPMLTLLGDYGGPTLTHALLPGSQAIDAGNNTAATSLDYDQRGVTRVVNSVVDIGSVERVSTIVTTLDDELDGNFSASDMSLREVLTFGTDDVSFDAGLNNGTITLDEALGQLVIAHDVIISGLSADDLIIDGDGESRVFYISSGVTAEIHDLTISGGNYTGTYGGNLFNDGDLTLDSVVVENGLANNGGGGIAQTSADSSLHIVNSTVRGNDAVTGVGGALYASAGSVDIDLSEFSENLTTGAYFIGTATVTITRSTVSENDYQGLAFWGDNVGVIDSNTIWGNVDVGIRLAGNSEIQIVNSTISGNATWGLNISQNSSTELLNSTVTDNGDELFGLGIYADTNTSVKLNNTIVAGNTGVIFGLDLQGNYFDVANSYNNLIGVGEYSNFDDQDGIHGNMVGTEASPVDPGLEALADNGGPTLTHALYSYSLAIDAGDNSLAAGLDYDQRGEGFDRIIDGGLDFLVDIGAFEYSA